MPGFLSTLIWMVLLFRRIPFAIELVGDPADAMSAQAFKHPLRPLLAWFLVSATRLQCKSACATAYVTAQALQKRYPPHPGRPTFHYTSLDLKDEDFVDAPRLASRFNTKAPVLVNVAMMHKTIKVQDVLIEAFARLRRGGSNARLLLIGDGDFRHVFEALAVERGVTDHVTFTGLLPKGQTLHERLDTADLFILPSRQEGLPRAALEAMARGLPCVISDVGGNGEIVPPEWMVPAGNVTALEEKLRQALSDPDALARQSERNLEVARAYHASRVSARRKAFYEVVRDHAKNKEKL